MANVVVVGGGISGLAAAEWLRDDHSVTVVDPQPGGKVRTRRIQGFAVDEAANGWLDSEPAVGRLVDRLGLRQRLLPAEHGPRWLATGERLIEIPMKPPDMLTSQVLSWPGKLRAAADLVMPRGPEEETVAAFVRRRLGDEVLRRLVAPMVAGIHAGDTEALSLAGCFPKLKQLETDHRSLLLASRGRSAGPPGRLTTLTGGAGVLTETLVERADIVPSSCIGLEPGPPWRVLTDQGALEADAVVLACPGHVSRGLLDFDDELPSLMGSFPYAPIAVVVAGLPMWDTAPKGFGFLVPPEEGRGILGTLFTSNSYPSHAPEGHVLIRTMLGGALNPLQASLELEGLVAIARRENERLLGPMPDALMTQVMVHPQGIPQYLLGHPQRVERLQAAAAPYEGLFLAGNHLRGIGVKDCMREGERVAEAVRAAL